MSFVPIVEKCDKIWLIEVRTYHDTHLRHFRKHLLFMDICNLVTYTDTQRSI